MTTREDELVERAKALLDVISPWPWKLGRPGEHALQTRDGAYLAEGINAWSSPRGGEMRDRDMEMASLAPELAQALTALSSEREILEAKLRSFFTALDDWIELGEGKFDNQLWFRVKRRRAALTGVTGG